MFFGSLFGEKRRNFDKKTFEKEHSDLFNKYVTVSDVKAYVKISEVK